MPHSPISPAIFYWGTPVVLITTLNPDNTPNIAPMSSAWWLGNRCVLGLARESQTPKNLLRTGQCVLNLASDDTASAVDRLAKTTGNADLTSFKAATGYRYVADKFGISGLTPVPSEVVAPPRIAECPAQMECRLVGSHPIMNDIDGPRKGFALAIEVEVLRTYVSEDIKMEDYENRIDPDKWKPLIMSFQRFYTIRDKQIWASRLAEIEEERYRGPPAKKMVEVEEEEEEEKRKVVGLEVDGSSG